jgi:hypothetical protein
MEIVVIGMPLLIFVGAETGANKPFPSNGYSRYNIHVFLCERYGSSKEIHDSFDKFTSLAKKFTDENL